MSVEQDVATLQGVPTFEVLAPEALRILAISAEERQLKAGEVLFRAGEASDAGYVLLSGRIELVQEQPGRRRKLSEILPGALVGELALLIQVPRPATARALEGTRLMRIPRTTFLRMLEGFPDAAVILRDRFAKRLEETLSALDTLRQDQLETPPKPRLRKK